MLERSMVVVILAGLVLGAGVACEDDADSQDVICYETADTCDDCPAGLFCGTLAAGGVECYTPCGTVDDCDACDAEKVCGYGEGDRQLCVRNP